MVGRRDSWVAKLLLQLIPEMFSNLFSLVFVPYCLIKPEIDIPEGFVVLFGPGLEVVVVGGVFGRIWDYC